jgi:WD40 repeat protein
MADGTIWLTAGNGKTYKLVEHLSRVTELEFNGKRLYSSSYDGRLLFWSIDYNSQMKAVTLFQSDSWLMDIIFSGDKDYIWTGEKNGTVSQYLVSLPKIAQRLRQNVKRNFTQEEWNYYVGKGIPYRKVKE